MTCVRRRGDALGVVSCFLVVFKKRIPAPLKKPGHAARLSERTNHTPTWPIAVKVGPTAGWSSSNDSGNFVHTVKEAAIGKILDEGIWPELVTTPQSRVRAECAKAKVSTYLY